ncbi:Neutral/alkaline nonlysosomal ceramidase [Fennellomyces sp. T-0311]|nr:Neutral/alkaline nonlysosomal ceramidase [Fennellomyces sp. T-0311]
MTRWTMIALLSTLLLCVASYQIGTGMGDMTGPISEITFMGYAEWSQVGQGLLQRIYARAYIVHDPASHKRVVFVNTDTQSMGDIIKKRVVERLQELYGDDVYTTENVMLSSTHTHSSMGGYLQYALFEISVKGWIEETTRPMIDGIVRAIVQAHERLQDGYITLNEGELLDTNINRSPAAYLLNPSEERALYKYDVDKTMTLLGFHAGHKELGFVNWFAVHGVSVNSTNRLVNGDNKGYAAYAAEHHFNGPDELAGKGPFVAGFAQANEGDVSPNTMGAYCLGTEIPCDGSRDTKCPGSSKCFGRGPGWHISDYESNRIIGQNQADMAIKLFKEATQRLDGPVDFRQKYWDITKAEIVKVDGTHGTPCPAAMGYGFAAGTTDNPAIDGIYQNMTHGTLFWDLLKNIVKRPSKYQVECQAPKAVLLDTGEMRFPYIWQPHILDVQLFRIGNFYIAAVPAEFTTMSGRRLRKAIKEKLIELGTGNNETTVVLSGPANGYASYVTTYEEYQMQRFEGGATAYGPYTLAAYIQVFEELAASIALGKPAGESEILPDLTNKAISLVPGAWPDRPKIGKKFGEVIRDIKATQRERTIATLYGMSGTTVSATFVAGNPRHDVKLEESFLTVERKLSNGDWQVVRNDHDYDTR